MLHRVISFRRGNRVMYSLDSSGKKKVNVFWNEFYNDDIRRDFACLGFL
jgi:hypothetical protein